MKPPPPVQRDSGPISAVHLPWDEKNPYQQSLAGALKELNVEAKRLEVDALHLPALFELSPHILHIHWLRYFYMYTGRGRALLNVAKLAVKLFLVRRRGIKVVWTAHNLYNHERERPVLNYLCASVVILMSDVVIAHCETAKRMLKTRFPFIRSGKIRIVHLGNYIHDYPQSMDPSSARRKLGFSEESFVILFLGNIRTYKGVLELIDCYREWSHDTNTALVIAGRPANEEMEEKVRAGVGDRKDIVFFPGKVAGDDVQVFMNAADVVAFPYRRILTSAAVMLAMSFGKPAIAPRMGCIGDMLDEKGAFLYDPEDEEGLAGALSRALSNRDRLTEMGLHNRGLAEKWDWASAARMTREAYLEAVGSPGKERTGRG